MGRRRKLTPRSRHPTEERMYALAGMLRDGYDPQYAATFTSFLDAGEPVVGMEILCDQLLDDEVSIEATLFQEIEELARLVQMQPKYWERLHTQVSGGGGLR